MSNASKITETSARVIAAAGEDVVRVVIELAVDHADESDAPRVFQQAMDEVAPVFREMGAVVLESTHRRALCRVEMRASCVRQIIANPRIKRIDVTRSADR
jgi:hypothetical protein